MQRSVGELTTRAIAQHAGVSDGVLYNHFDDKTDLLMAAMLRRYGRLVDRLEAATPTAGEGTVVGNVQAYGRALSEVEGDVDAPRRRAPRPPAAAAPVLDRDPPAAVRHRPPATPARRLPGAEQGLGRVRADLDVEAAVTVVFGVCAMTALTGRLNPTADRAGLDRHLDAALAAAVSGFAPAA